MTAALVATSPSAATPRLPQAVTVVGTTPFSARDTLLFAARPRAVFVLVVAPGQTRSIEVRRISAGGAIASNHVVFDEPNALIDVSAGRFGVYGGTAVIRRLRLTKQADELIRIDPRTLTIRARATFPASVKTVAADRGLWATIGDGRVVRLNPTTLTIESSRRLLPTPAATIGTVALAKPAFGLGSVWILAGNARKLELVRLDPKTLAVRSRTRVPSGGRLAQALHDVAADAQHVYLVGGAIARVDANGRLGRAVLVPGLATAVVAGDGLLGLSAEPPAVVRIAAGGGITARTPLRDAGAALALSGSDAWLVGSAGHGEGVVHVRLVRRRS